MAVMRRHLVAGIAVGACISSLLLGSTHVGAVDPRVEAACSSDYFAYCGQHDPDGPAVRRCMRVNGEKLTPSCIDALVAAGEVSRKEVARRSRQSR